MHDIEITNKMLTSCKSAHSRYLIALEDAKRQSQVTEKETKRKLIKIEIADVKRHHVEVMSCITSLEQDVEKYCDEAEEKHYMSFFLKRNALRKAIKDKKQVVKDLEFSIYKIEEEAKSV